MDEEAFAWTLLAEEQVAAFRERRWRGGVGLCALAYATSNEKIEQALERIHAFCGGTDRRVDEDLRNERIGNPKLSLSDPFITANPHLPICVGGIMTEQRFVLVVNENRRIHLPEGIPFNTGDPLHLLWDGNVLQISRTKPKKLSDAYAKVQKDGPRVLEGTDELARRLAEDEARRRRREFDELFGGLPKQE